MVTSSSASLPLHILKYILAVFLWFITMHRTIIAIGAYSDNTKTTGRLRRIIFNITLLKKNSSYIRKFRREQLQSHIWLTASSYMVKYLRISSYIRRPFLIYDFATSPIWIFLYMRKFFYYFLSVCTNSHFTSSYFAYLQGLKLIVQRVRQPLLYTSASDSADFMFWYS